MPREFAPGIPTGRVIKPIPRVRSKSDNQEWDVSLSMHPALRRGDHYDLRLVDPKGRGHSWALPRLPEPGQSTYAAQQATHSKSYSLRKKPWEIPPGYGQTQIGRKVEPVFVQKAEVVEAGPEKVRFLRHHGQETDEFTLRKVYREGMTPLWALNNATKNRNTLEGQKLPSSKPKYKEVRPEQVDFSDVGEVMTPKFDGAHVLVDMKGPKAPMRVYSYRPTERRTGVIEHTYKFPDFQKRRTTNSLRNTMIRAELWASKDGKAIPAEQLGGILNAGVLNSRRKQQEMGVDLRLTGIDVVKHKGKNYQNKTFEDKLKALRDVTRGTKGLVELPPVARTESEKRQLMTDIESGKFPETREGTVLHRTDSAAPPTKVKFKPQDDVYVREVFSKSRGKARGHAGGFAYSVTPDGPVVGRVGTGFDHKTRKDMLDNPEKYVGRVAKVKSQGPFPSGALRAPSFDEWHIDKTPPELMKEGASRWREALRAGEIGVGEIKKLRRAKLLDYDREVAGLERGTSNIARKLGVKIRSPRPKLQERIEFDDSFMPIRAYKERVAAPTTYQHDKRLVTAPKSKFSLTDAPQGSEDALRAHSRALDAVSRRHEIDEARAAFHSQRRGVKPRPFASHEAPSVITSERRNLALLHPKVRQLFPHSRNVEEAHFRGVLGRPFSGSRADVRSINKDWRSPKTSSELMKEGEERLVDSLKEYKSKVVDKDRVLDAGYMAAKSTRRFGAARAGLRLARDYLEREHPNVLRRLGIHRGD